LESGLFILDLVIMTLKSTCDLIRLGSLETWTANLDIDFGNSESTNRNRKTYFSLRLFQHDGD